jgi:hypothetical protein
MKNILIIASLFFTFNISATESMRNCMLLPVTDSGDSKIGFKVFEEIENYIKDSSWCTYKSNSELINILGQYSKNLESHLTNKDVLKVIADKTKAGTLIRINLQTGAQAADLTVEIIGENGEDRYFKESVQLKNNDVTLISQTIKNWLDVYEKTIPYDGRVKGILGEQFTIDIGKHSHLYNGSEIIIERMTGKKQHPLLKDIVDFQTEKVAEAKIFDVGESQAQAKVVQYENNKKLKLEDWVKIRSGQQRNAVEKITYGEKDNTDFGKLGIAGIYLNAGTSTASQAGTTIRSMSGLVYGAEVEGEIWVTRNYWIGADYGKKLGTYSKDQGVFATDTNSANNGHMRVKLGYKYLPMGFFYGPQLEGYLGYASYSYGLETHTADQFTEVNFGGVLLGVRGSLPLYESIRVYMLFDFLMAASYTETATILGTSSSNSNYRIEFGGQYTYAPNIAFVSGLSILSNKANFTTGDIKEEQFKDVSVRLGTIFTF